ncbi:hypothetical protein SNEBB_003758 [Seison nebaliae]|nr:hypothetical protein SNEBB_003758 [Seison nebaliae]
MNQNGGNANGTQFKDAVTNENVVEMMDQQQFVPSPPKWQLMLSYLLPAGLTTLGVICAFSQMISIYPRSIIGGLLMMMAALFIGMMELGNRLPDAVKDRLHLKKMTMIIRENWLWQKGLIYLLLITIPLIICPRIANIFAFIFLSIIPLLYLIYCFSQNEPMKTFIEPLIVSGNQRMDNHSLINTHPPQFSQMDQGTDDNFNSMNQQPNQLPPSYPESTNPYAQKVTY